MRPPDALLATFNRFCGPSEEFSDIFSMMERDGQKSPNVDAIIIPFHV